MTWKMPEWKLHTPENDRKITPQKMAENSYLENSRMENAHPGFQQNIEILSFLSVGEHDLRVEQKRKKYRHCFRHYFTYEVLEIYLSHTY